MKTCNSVLLFSLLLTFFSACQEEKPEASVTVDDPALERALEMRKQLLAGASFQEMAEEYSEDPGSAQYGGELGAVHFGQFVPKFEKAIRSLKPGEISEPVRTKFGYHLIQLVEIKGDQFTSRHILIKP
uniref:Peptidylprolyl isomerase n=1 Tax=Roseihalotalea indica TaxID=2867963 RepID=A0AA49GR10_9BACT|nr:peptidylprolyl isomerase [Tunicatimonas sp. TK19036]